MNNNDNMVKLIQKSFEEKLTDKKIEDIIEVTDKFIV